MARPSKLAETRKELLPIVAKAFVELGYRRATTAQLAERCGVRENILYRLWSDKKDMFLTSIEFVYDFAEATWKSLLETSEEGTSTALRLLDFESLHHGEFGHYRLIFMGLSECDDKDVRRALRRLFVRFQKFLEQQIALHRRRAKNDAGMTETSSSWAFIGLGTALNIGRELGLIDSSDRKRMLSQVGKVLLDG